MKKLLRFLVLLLIILGVIGYFLPTNFSVNKSINISSNSAHIHEFVGDLNKWQEWTVWKGDDPDIDIIIGKKTKGIGASQRWTDKHGGGSLTFTSWSPDNGIEYDLIFDGGKNSSKSRIKYDTSSKTRTRVNWSLDGDMAIPIVGGYMAVFFKYFIGDMFQESLSELKRLVEQDK